MSKSRRRVQIVESGPEHPYTRATFDQDYFLDCVTYWQKRLGLDSWDIDIELKPGFGMEGYCQTFQGKKALLTFREDQIIGDIEYTVVHELLHIFMAGYEQIRDKALKKALPRETHKVLTPLLETPYEDAIETLAKTLVALEQEGAATHGPATPV